MSILLRYSQSLRGALEFTGNTQGLSTDTCYALSQFSQANVSPPNGNLTTNYLNASSSAYLVMTAGAAVKYAELVWAFNFIEGSAEESTKDNAISFITPNGSYTITPDAVTSQATGPFDGKKFYTRSADVTNIVKAAGAGLYTVERIPGALLLPILGTGQNYSGWVLQVVYEDATLPIREINLWVSNILQTTSSSVTDVLFSGFGTSASGSINGRLALFAGDGNICIDGEKIYFGTDNLNLVQLSGPNNPLNNFFTSQINDGNSESATVGQLNQTGTFGTHNQGQAGSPSPWRNTIDITNVSLNSALVNSQTTGVIRFSTTQDSFIVNALGTQIDVLSPIFHPTKTSNKLIADLGETITYTATFTNTGTVGAKNLVFNDIIPQNTSFVTDSVTIGGVSQPSVTPSNVIIGNVAIGQTITITYQVKVESIPENNTFKNDYEINYSYTPVTGVDVNDKAYSDTVTITVKNAKIFSVKKVDKNFVDINETLTYSVTLTNKGNTTADNVVFNDAIPTGTTLVPNTVSVNGTLYAGADPALGVNIASILANATVTIVFKVKVGNAIPSVNPIINSSSTNYNYIVDPANAPISATSTSNQVSLTVKHADLISSGNLIKTVDKNYADLNEIITYTITIKNTGNTPANNLILTDVVPTGTAYKPDTLTVNSIPFVGNPNDGINIGTINAGATIVVSFKANIISIPIVNPVENKGNITYTYTVDPALPNEININENTNTVFTQINNASINSQLTVDNQFVDLRDVLTYSLVLTNKGNVAANNIIVINPAPSGSSFVLNSVLIDGIAQFGSNPNSGINVGTIGAGSNKTVVFKVQLGVIIPQQNPIANSSTVNFNYLVDPSSPPVSGVSTSNVVLSQVNHADLVGEENLVKLVDKAFADIGDTITYTIKIKNTGNSEANNVVVTDPLAVGLAYKLGSLTIDGVPKVSDPINGINLGSVLPNQTKNISFKAIINSLPAENPISNEASVAYTYTIDPSFPNKATNSGNTNTVITRVNHADLISEGNVVKSVDKQFAKCDEILTYSILLKNTGNIEAKNVIVKDVIPEGTEFIQGSFTINGVLHPNLNPSLGINIGDILATKSSIVNFKVLIKALPLNKALVNKANLEYSYIVDAANSIEIKVTGTTNSVSTRVTQPDFVGSNGNNFVKSVDKVYVDLGDEVTYTIFIKNTGNIQAENVVLTDLIQEGAVFKQGSVIINGNSKPTVNPNLGIPLDIVNTSNTMVISFKVKITSVPQSGKIDNQATLDFKYTLDPSKPQQEEGSINSNKTSLIVSHGEVLSNNAVKTVDKVNTTSKDIVTYSISTKNTGNVDIINVIVTDTIPNGAMFINGSVKINNVEYANANPITGINVGTIAAQGISLVTFQVKVLDNAPSILKNSALIDYSYFSDPSRAVIKNSITTNTVQALNLMPKLTLTKSSNRIGAVVEDIIRYTIVVKNTGPVDVNNIIISDLLTPDIKYVGNLIVNGVINTSDITLGVNVGSLSLDQSVIISFDAKIIAIPKDKKIINSSIATYNYVVNQGGTVFSESNVSNENTIVIYKPSIIFDKAYDKSVLKVGDTFVYTLIATNNGDITINDAVIKEILPDQFKVEEVKIDGVIVEGDVNSGLQVGTINVGETKIITLVVRVLELIGGNNIWQ